MTIAPTIADPLQSILDRLDGVKAEGTGRWSARCPAHEDRVASLSVSRGNDGRALIYCHAGCKARDIVERIGLRVTDLFAQAPSTSSNGQRQIVATYDYSDQAGVLLFQVVRYQPKDFRQLLVVARSRSWRQPGTTADTSSCSQALHVQVLGRT